MGTSQGLFVLLLGLCTRMGLSGGDLLCRWSLGLSTLFVAGMLGLVGGLNMRHGANGACIQDLWGIVALQIRVRLSL